LDGPRPALLDLSAWWGMQCMLLGRVLVSVMALRIRVVAMQRCERQNRPVNLGQRQLRGDQLEVVTVADGSAVTRRAE